MIRQGDLVIDVKKNKAVVVVSIIESIVDDVYVLRDDDEVDYYISGGDNIIPYVKGYFDKDN